MFERVLALTWSVLGQDSFRSSCSPTFILPAILNCIKTAFIILTPPPFPLPKNYAFSLFFLPNFLLIQTPQSFTKQFQLNAKYSLTSPANMNPMSEPQERDTGSVEFLSDTESPIDVSLACLSMMGINHSVCWQVLTRCPFYIHTIFLHDLFKGHSFEVGASLHRTFSVPFCFLSHLMGPSAPLPPSHWVTIDSHLPSVGVEEADASYA